MNSSAADPALIPELLVSSTSDSLEFWGGRCGLNNANYPIFMPPETKWYGVEQHTEAGVRQFLVTDPDGYLIRFQESLGARAITE